MGVEEITWVLSAPMRLRALSSGCARHISTCTGSEEGSCLRRIDSCMTQLYARSNKDEARSAASPAISQ